MRTCRWKDCNFDLTQFPPNQKYCPVHSKEIERSRKREYAKDRYGKNRTLNGRILINKHGNLRESISARAAKGYSDLWKVLETLDEEDLPFLVAKKKKDLKDAEDPKEIKRLRTEIAMINDACKKKNQQKKDDKVDKKILEKIGSISEASKWIDNEFSALIPKDTGGMTEEQMKQYKKKLSDITTRELEIEVESINEFIKNAIKYHNTKRLVEKINQELERRIEREEITREELEKIKNKEASKEEIEKLKKKHPELFSEDFL